MNREQSLSVYKVDINVDKLKEAKEVDSEIWKALSLTLEDVIINTNETGIKYALENRTKQLEFLLNNLDENVRKIRTKRNTSSENTYINKKTDDEIKADNILNQQLLKIYNNKKFEWIHNNKTNLKRVYLEKMHALATILERMDENMEYIEQEGASRE